MAQQSLERAEEIPGQDSSELGESARWRGECEKDTETELMVSVGRGVLLGSCTKHLHKQKLSCFHLLQMKLLLV